MHDAADHPAVIGPRDASRVSGKMRRKPRELPVGKPKVRTRHHKLPSRRLNYASASLGIPFMDAEPNLGERVLPAWRIARTLTARQAGAQRELLRLARYEA